MSLRRILGLAAGASLLVSLVVAQPASASTANLGPVLTSLPDATRDGGPGTDELNAAVAGACNSGAALAYPRWATLPTGDLGVVAAQGSALIYFIGHSLIGAQTRTALVDANTASVLSCDAPAEVGAASRGVVVAWLTAKDYATRAWCDGYMYTCGEPEVSIYVGPTTGKIPSNDKVTSPTVITSLPYEDSGDRTLADDDGPLLSTGSWISHQTATVWYSYTATSSVSFPIAAPGSDVTVGRINGAVVDPVDFAGVLVAEAGSTYLIAVSTLVDEYALDTPLPRGKPYTLMVGAPGTAVPPSATARAGSAGAVHVEWIGANNASQAVGHSIEFVVQGAHGSVTTVADLGVGQQSREIGGLVEGDLYTITARINTSAGRGLPIELSAHAGLSALDDSAAPVNIGVTVNAEGRFAVVSWTAASDFPSQVTGYQVTRDGLDTHGTASVTWTLGSSVLSEQFNYLKASSFYTFTVAPLTANGPRQSSSVSVFVQPTATVPGSDLGVTYQDAGSGVASGEWLISWKPPSSDGQSPITRYRLTRDGLGVDGKPSYQIDLPASTKQFILSGLLGSVSYKVSVQAVNAVGAGARETLTTEQWAPVPPGAPTNVHAVAGDASALVSWTPPTDWGSSPAAGFYVDVHHGSDPVSTWGPTAADATSFTVTRLTNGQPYTFTVRAKNADVAGAESSPSDEVTPGVVPGATVPGAPVVGRATAAAVAGKVRATVRWTPPVSDGGGAVTGYLVYAYVLDRAGQPAYRIGVTKRINAAYRSWTLTLPPGAYRFTVRAANAVGYGAASALTNRVAPITVSSAPIVGAALSGTPGGPVTATATWKPPVSTGGTPVTAYVVYAYRVSSSGRILSTTVTSKLPASFRSHVFPYLTYGWYRFAVRAVNVMGYSAYSAKSARVIGR
ncbi:MAG: fibronectin type III domain-containing protein [Candidatus Nanopelagicales bacterium]